MLVIAGVHRVSCVPSSKHWASRSIEMTPASKHSILATECPTPAHLDRFQKSARLDPYSRSRRLKSMSAGRTEDPEQVGGQSGDHEGLSDIDACAARRPRPVAARVARRCAEQVSREQDIADLRLGQRILVDDGSCPAGQIKEVSGAQMTTSWRRAHAANAFRDWGKQKR